MLTKIISFFLENKLLTFLFLSFIIILGAYFFLSLKMDAFPDITNVQAEVIATSPTLSPLEIERLVTYPIETSIRGIKDLKEVRSITKFGISVVTAIFKDDTDIYFARQQVFERLSNIRDKLPEDCEVEMAPITTAMGEIYQYTLEGPLSEDEIENLTRLRTIQDYTVSPLLKSVEGVCDVNSFGGYIEQINVLADPKKLQRYNLTVNDLFDAIEKNNLSVGGSSISKYSEQLIVQGSGMFESLKDLENIAINSVGGSPVYLKDIADVKYSHVIRKGAAVKDGKKEIVGGIVMMLRGENSREVVKRVEKKVEEINQSGILPDGIRIVPFYNRSEIIEKVINLVLKALAEGAILVILIIFLFIRQIRGALIIVLSLPLSAFLTFSVMKAFNVGANLMSLGGLAISIGMIVDASIIQVENVQRHLGEKIGKEKFSTVLKAVIEVRKPSVFGEIIIASVLLPILSLQGMEGKMFSPLAITIIIALLSSLTISILFVPSLCYVFLKPSSKEETFLYRIIKKAYLPLLEFSLKKEFFVIFFFLLILGLAVFLLPRIGTEFIPVWDEGAFDMDIQLLPGVSLEKALEVSKLVGSKIMEFQEIKTLVSRTGQTGIAIEARSVDRTGFVGVLRPKSQWKTSSSREELFEKMRDSVSKIPGIVFSFSQPIQCRISELMEGTRAQLILKVFGEDMEILHSKAKEVIDILSGIRGAVDIVSESIFYLPYLSVKVNREKIARYGLSIKDVLKNFELAMGEKRVTRLYEGSRFINIALMFPAEMRTSINTLKEIMIKTPSNTLVPLNEFVEINIFEGPFQISKENGKKRIGIELNVEGMDTGSFVKKAEHIIKERVQLPEGYYIEWGGQFQQQQKTMKNLMIITPIVLLFIFVMLIISFKSVKHALLVISILPFSLAGGVFVLYLSDYYLSIPASLGFIATFGISVLNGVVLVSYIKKLGNDGLSLKDAILKGCEIRLRPIMMTALTTAFGLIPMLLSSGPGSEIPRALAIVVVGGLLSATITTLIFLPSLYKVFLKRD